MDKPTGWTAVAIILGTISQFVCLVMSGIMTTEGDEEPLHTYIANSKLATGQKLFLLTLTFPSTIAFLLIKHVALIICWFWRRVLGAKMEPALHKKKLRVVEVQRIICEDLDKVDTQTRYEIQYKSLFGWRNAKTLQSEAATMKEYRELNKHPVVTEQKRIIA